MGALLALLWVLEIVDQASGNALDEFGIRAREVDGLPYVFTAPFLHFGFDHLTSNSLPFFVLGVLVLLGGLARWVWSTLITVLSSGLTAWLLTPANSIIAGASGVIFGWLTYLLARGIYSRDIKQILISVAVLIFYGGVLWGVLPGQAGVSWQGHLGGALGGVLAARLLHRRSARRTSSSPPAPAPW
ncbi:MAG: rhomboid family intramembrane serine protease [Propionibacteriaceae bacterium]